MIQRERLRQIRDQRGMSQGALGKLIGKDAKYISKLELGVRSGVTSTTLVRLAVALDVSADYLLGLPDRTAPAPTDHTRPSPEHRGTPTTGQGDDTHQPGQEGPGQTEGARTQEHAA